MYYRPTKISGRQRLRAILHQRCPRCCQGGVFRGVVAMREECMVCGFHFGREEGYFVGAMYASYFLALGVLGVIFGILWLLLRSVWSIRWIMGLTVVFFLPCVPTIFRYSRVLWMHIDWMIDPDQPGNLN